MKKMWMSILLIFFITSCGTDEKTIPPNVFPNEKMVEVLVNIQLIEATSTSHIQTQTMDAKRIAEIYGEEFQRMEITSEQFVESFNYYQSNPELLEKIMDGVLEELSKRQAIIAND